MNVGVLDFSQPIGAKPSQFTDREGAEFLVQAMAAERISRKVIRLFAPDSSFRRMKPSRPAYIPDKLPGVEIPGLHFFHASMRRQMSAIRGELGTVYIAAADTQAFCTAYFAGIAG